MTYREGDQVRRRSDPLRGAGVVTGIAGTAPDILYVTWPDSTAAEPIHVDELKPAKDLVVLHKDPDAPADFDIGVLEGWVVDKSELPHELRPSPVTVFLHGHESPGAVARPAHQVERVADGELADVLLVGPPPKHAEVPLSDEAPPMVEQPTWWPSGRLVTALIVAIAVGVLFIICAPIVKMTFLE